MPRWKSATPHQCVCENIERYRKRRGLSQKQLAAEMAKNGYEIDATKISDLERGERKAVTVDELMAFAAALNASPTALLLPAVDTWVAVLPKIRVKALDLAEWIRGASALPTYRKWAGNERFEPGTTDAEVAIKARLPLLYVLREWISMAWSIADTDDHLDALRDWVERIAETASDTLHELEIYIAQLPEDDD